MLRRGVSDRTDPVPPPLLQIKRPMLLLAGADDEDWPVAKAKAAGQQTLDARLVRVGPINPKTAVDGRKTRQVAAAIEQSRALYSTGPPWARCGHALRACRCTSRGWGLG